MIWKVQIPPSLPSHVIIQTTSSINLHYQSSPSIKNKLNRGWWSLDTYSLCDLQKSTTHKWFNNFQQRGCFYQNRNKNTSFLFILFLNIVRSLKFGMCKNIYFKTFFSGYSHHTIYFGKMRLWQSSYSIEWQNYLVTLFKYFTQFIEISP